MHNHHDHNTHFNLRDLLSGVLIGGLVGTTIMLLSAPQSGKKTRAQIRRKSFELRDQASETIDEARQRTETALRQMRLKARQLQRSARNTAQGLQDRSQALLEEQKDRVESALAALQPAARDGRN